MKKIVNFTSDQALRLDSLIKRHLDSKDILISRTQIHNIIKEQGVKVAGVIVHQANFIPKISDAIEMEIIIKSNQDIEPKDIPLDIIFEDDDIIVLNKQNNLVVHPAPGNYTNTLVNGLKYYTNQLGDINGVERLGIVHRIDKQTTGLLVVCKNNFAMHKMSEQIKNKEVEREYCALVRGVIKEKTGTIDAPIGRDHNNRLKMTVTHKNAKNAVTNFVVLERFKDYTYIKCILDTGRTHQIRVHLNFIKHPVLGDNTYGSKEDESIEFGQYLHAYKLSFNHPRTSEKMEFTAPLPKEMAEYLQNLKGKGI